MFYEGHMRVFLRKRENDKYVYHGGSSFFCTPFTTHNDICPVKLMKDFVRRKHKLSHFVLSKISHQRKNADVCLRPPA